MAKVAIITPTYNRGDNGLLEKTMRSVLAQTYEDFRYIVVDDGSTDSTPEVVGRYTDERIIYNRRERTPGQKVGASTALNHGISMLDNMPEVELVTFLHSDDMHHPDNIREKVGAIEDSMAVYSWMGVCDAHMQPKCIEKGVGTEIPKEAANRLKGAWSIDFPHQGLMLRKSLLDEVGLFDENLGYGEDRDFTVRVLEQLEPGQIVLVPKVLHYYRNHDNSVTGDYLQSGQIPSDRAYFYGKHRKPRMEMYAEMIKRPHTFLPEPVKRLLRPVRDIVRKSVVLDTGFVLDPITESIEKPA